jgi:2-amino-4-hydroxy-6-hydroxymethyldihydropteridine diphosphokinase
MHRGLSAVKYVRCDQKTSRSQSNQTRLPLEHRSGKVTAQLPGPGDVLVALGANCPGPWGTPRQTLERALKALEQEGIVVTARSPLYETAAIGQTRQHPYVNAVARVATAKPPAALLRVLKQIERRAGRRGGRPWGNRTLDLDIVDYKGLVQNWRFNRHSAAPGSRRPLILPHPLIQDRPFVLRPLLDVAPGWRHPALGSSGRALWERITGKAEGRVLRRL